MPRALVAVSLVLLATACGGASASDTSTGPAVSSPGDTSEDELNTTARFTHLKKATDADLNAFYAATAKLDGAYRGIYRFNKAGPEATDQDARMKRVKEVMHRYMCSFFDESIDIGRTNKTGAAAVATTLADVDLDSNASEAPTADTAKLSSTLGDVFKDKKMDIMSGGASGNNTGGEVMGIYDIAHNEVLFFGFTNCGSDD